jgi:pimeloyl-ACP methyl ester carboxylesterase
MHRSPARAATIRTAVDGGTARTSVSYDRAIATYALIHGAADSGWYWHLVAAELRERGHDAIAPDLPCDDDAAGFPEYAETVVEAIGDRTEVVVVAQSLGGFTAPLVCERIPVDLLVLVAGMVPLPGEKPDDWFENTGWGQVQREQAARGEGPRDDGEIATFFHDVEPELAAEALRHGREQSDTPGREPWPLQAWPDVPTRYLLCRDDRFFPAEFVRRMVSERLGIVPDEIDAAHTPALSRPIELAERLEAYRGRV